MSTLNSGVRIGEHILSIFLRQIETTKILFHQYFELTISSDIEISVNSYLIAVRPLPNLVTWNDDGHRQSRTFDTQCPALFMFQRISKTRLILRRKMDHLADLAGRQQLCHF